LIQLVWKEAHNLMKEAAASFCISRLIGRFSVYIWRAVTEVVFAAPQFKLQALFWAVSRWFMLALLVVSITSLPYFIIGLTQVTFNASRVLPHVAPAN
jgi:hypothetical protein